MNSNEDFVSAVELFYDGEASSGKEYYAGVLAEVVLIDLKYRIMEELDNVDASEREILNSINNCLDQINHCRFAIKQYADKKWPEKDELNRLTHRWINSIESMMDDYAKPLAAPMAKPDEEWNDEEFELYERWNDSYDAFLIVDDEWVQFQYVYAIANGFILDDETIDIDGMVEENN